MLKEQHYIVSHRRPFHWLLAIIILVIASNLAHWYINRSLNTKQIEQLSALKQEKAQLQQAVKTLQDQNQTLTVQVKDQTQMLAMNAVTDQQLRTDLQQSQNKVMELNKELLFYQNITQGTASSDLQIRELHLREDTGNNDTFYYRIVITQGKKINKAIKADLNVFLNSAGTEPRLVNTHSVTFRHVQVLEGSLQLNKDEKPQSLFIQLKQGKKTLTEHSFNWEIEHAVAM